MEDTAYRAIAIVGAGAIMPDAPNVAAFWDNIKDRAQLHQRGYRRTAGTRHFTMTPITVRPIRPTPRSAAGCGSFPGSP